VKDIFHVNMLVTGGIQVMIKLVTGDIQVMIKLVTGGIKVMIKLVTGGIQVMIKLHFSWMCICLCIYKCIIQE
jgi:hypothetical protein